MNEIHFRLAKPSDAKQIANCHWHVRDRYSQGVFLSLGKPFLKKYYKLLLNDPFEVMVCAESENGKIIGFCNATIDAKKQAVMLKKHVIGLAAAAFWSLVAHPKLIKGVWQRYRSLSNKGTAQFVHTEGVRGEYWCWLKEAGDVSQSVELNRALKHIVYGLGFKEMYSEVDKFNKHVYKYFKAMRNIEVVEEITLPDGRERALLLEHLQPINQ